MKNLEILFLHPCRRFPDGYEYPLFPMGFIPMASLLRKHGYETRIVNLALEKALRHGRLDVENFLRSAYEYSIAAIDLNWWVNSYDSIQLAKLCKEINPNCLTILGGLTASFFAEEILKQFSFVDAVIKGEGEIPVLTLTANYLKGKSVKDTPNIAQKANKRIYSSDILLAPDTLDDFTYTDTSLLEHWEEHLWLHARPEGYNPSLGVTVFSPWLCIARGCPFNCSFCGGAEEAQRRCSGRRRVARRSPAKIVDDITLLEDMGVRLIQFSHGPAMVEERFFTEILDMVKKERVDIGVEMELWQPISTNFLRKIAETFSTLTLTMALGSGSEEVRLFNRGVSISNEDYLNFLDKGTECGVKYNLFFATNLPLETKETFKSTLRLMEELILKKDVTNIWGTNYALEPASPMFLRPEEYGVVPHLRGFMDYYQLLSKEQGIRDPIGYHTHSLSEKNSIDMVREVYAKKDELFRGLKRPFDFSFY